MEFCERLDSYIDLLSCTSSELARASGVSLATISRYRSGERIPSSDSPQVAALARGISRISRTRRGAPVLDENDVLAKLSSDAMGALVDYEAFRAKIATLISSLGYSNSEIARAMSYDPSYISRIVSGSRKPADVTNFINQVAVIVSRRFGNPTHAALVAQLIDCPTDLVSTPDECAKAVAAWLSSDNMPALSPVGSFLHKVDAFDIEEFARAINFDVIRMPQEHLQLPSTRTYTGISEIMEAELDFINATLASRSMEPIISYSDMPLDEMTEDPEFPKKWLFGIALMLKKGLHLNIIHNVNRPFTEMMMGLEGWIPLYMTGQITPYYLENNQSTVFLHNLKVSGAAALAGQAIVGHHNEGTYVVTRVKKDVAALTRRAKRLLEHAAPLMKVYRGTECQSFNRFVEKARLEPGSRYAILSTPPIQTIPDDLLERVLEDNGVSEELRVLIRNFVRQSREKFVSFLGNCTYTAELAVLEREEFERYPAILSLSEMLLEQDIVYTYDQYLEHVEAMRALAKRCDRFVLDLCGTPTFRNIQVLINKGSWAVISKVKAPVAHFVIENNRLLEAIENYAPIIESQTHPS